MAKKGLFLVSLLLFMVLVSAYIPSSAILTDQQADTSKPTHTAVSTAEPTPTPPFPVGPGGKIPLGIVLPSFDRLFNQTYYINYLSKSGFKATILSSQNNPKQEIKNIQTLIDQNVEVMIFCPVEPWNASVQTSMAKDAGMKVIVLDRLAMNSPDVDFYVGFSPTEVGNLQAQYLVDHISGT
jgi:ABC-type sugar transport system substrate-binding protein